MLYGRVVGTIWATRKDESLEGLSFRIVEKIDLDGTASGSHIVAIDSVSAGVGEIVLLAQGSSARQTAQTRDRPVDAVIMAIVDNHELADGESA